MRAVGPVVSVGPVGPAVRAGARIATRVGSMAAFALRANLRGGLTRGGAVLAVAVMLVGPVVAVTRDRAWSFDGQFGFYGFLVLALFTLRSGHQEQRELGLAVFFRRNLSSSVEHALAMVLSVVGAWIAVCALGFLAVLAVSGGDVELAGWYTASWGLRTLLLVGLVPLVEQVASFRLPFLVPALAYFTMLIALSIVLPEDAAIALFVPMEPGDHEALGRLARQVAIALPTASLAFVLVSGGEPWVRRRLGRAPRAGS